MDTIQLCCSDAPISIIIAQNERYFLPPSSVGHNTLEKRWRDVLEKVAKFCHSN